MHVEDRKFSRDVQKVLSLSEKTLISKSETTPWGWHGIKQPSGKHNTINILLTRNPRVMGEYSVEVAVQTVNLLPLWFGWFDSIFSHYFVKINKI